eukprot:TRINITY_DN84667_c0_g1_i1.p1 TRINITY_DN84667_c0_g1~~TRINITY_DN84667_c0_g1_i1.p1  ORF type:complete len:348 (-),score=96.85 TRINITY_DN84667_c0_g1_i1:65-1042(-)
MAVGSSRPALRAWFGLLACFTAKQLLFSIVPSSGGLREAKLAPRAAAATSQAAAAAEGEVKRRHLLATLGASPLALQGRPALAETEFKIGYQLKMPENWDVFRKDGYSKGEQRPKALLQGVFLKDNAPAADLKIVRVPLVTSARDPQGTGAMLLANFFYGQGKEREVSGQQVVDNLQASMKSQAATFDYKDLSMKEFEREGRRYLRYDYETSRCEGVQVLGMKGSKTCAMPGKEDEQLPTPFVRHTVVTTLAPEVTVAKTADGEPVPAGPEVLWILDIQAAAKTWDGVSDDIEKFLVESFGVGTDATLEKLRKSNAELWRKGEDK